ncbi:TraY domain-containing protein [Escherichia coli]|nr:TraY domain-containing protein [Escherichia coli]HCU1619411.1 TraY domain-containing protein [Escherichia coli]
MNEKQLPKIVSVTVLLDPDTNQKLISAAKLSGYSKGLEAGLRLTHHLNTVPKLDESSYWEILLPKDN